jgi:hypothetical protein
MADSSAAPGFEGELLVDLKNEIGKILGDVAPGEYAAFEVFGEDLVREMAADLRSPARSSKGGTFEFGPALESCMVTVHLVAGTLALIDIIFRAKGAKDERDLKLKIQDDWTQFLVSQGMAVELARSIPVKYSLDLAAFLAKHKIADPR